MRRPTLALIALALLPACERARDLDERIPAAPGGHLEVDLDLGDGLRPDPGSLEVRGHGAHEVRILTDVSGWGASAVRFRVDRGGDALRLFGTVGGTFSWMFGGPHVAVRVWVPRDFSLDLRCSAGPVRVDDVSGAVSARSNAGSVDVTAVEGSVRVRTVDGDVRVSDVRGAVDVRARDGDISLEWIEGAVEARTGTGEIDASHAAGPVVARSDRGGIEISDAGGPVEAKTARGAVSVAFTSRPEGLVETRRGSVEVWLPDGAGVELDAATRRGSVEIDGEAGSEPQGRGERIEGPVFGGGAPLRLYTARGTVSVRRR